MAVVSCYHLPVFSYGVIDLIFPFSFLHSLQQVFNKLYKISFFILKTKLFNHLYFSKEENTHECVKKTVSRESIKSSLPYQGSQKNTCFKGVVDSENKSRKEQANCLESNAGPRTWVNRGESGRGLSGYD